MSELIKYIYSSIWYNNVEQKKDEIKIEINQRNKEKSNSLISVEDLLSVKLKMLNNTIPSPARNMPNIDKFILQQLNKAQLNDILNVKLKKTKIDRIKPLYYEPVHPVLKELLQKTKRI